MAERRKLSLTGVDQIMPEVDRLLSAGYEPAGNWSLGQVCKHLCEAMKGSVEGYPSIPFPNNVILGLLRPLMGAKFKKRILTLNEMQSGIRLPDKFVPTPGLDDRAEAEALRGMIRMYAAHAGAMAAHPMFGSMTRDEWDRLHAIHAALHLGFLVPSGSVVVAS